ncbi:MAG: alanine--tRNA ligase [Patescibacteria group bacterium]
MNSDEIRKKFLEFFEKREHAIIPSASLVPENDPSALFNSAGMQPLVPYLLGEPHPKGKRLVNIQKCVRTTDIDEVGDNIHLTFFEMLGNWSLGDYFKEDAIKWSYELLTSKGEGFGLDPKRLYVSIFAGDDNAPRDEESAQIWKKVGMPENRIYYLSADKNWWSAGDSGPCGPDSEMYYDITEEGLGDLTHEQFVKADNEQKVVEIWNDVFMEYEKKDGKVVGKLKNKNVDTGAGLERLAVVLQGKDNVFETDLFLPIITEIKKCYGESEIRTMRIIADHVKTAVFMIADGVIPSNTDKGYVLRRILRRAIFKGYKLALGFSNLYPLIPIVTTIYRDTYPELKEKEKFIHEVFEQEEIKFRKTIEKGQKAFTRGEDPFILFSSHGFPFELTKELAKEKGIGVNEEDFKKKLAEHQVLSRAGAEQKFKGGLADASEQTVKYHTATHLLHQALHDVLGDEVRQKGSNLTSERLRFDFSFPRKLTDEEKEKVEKIVNQKISENLPVQKIILPKEEAEKTGARHFFDQKYPDEVSVYCIGESLANAYSKEFCGGPHVENIGILGHFKIIKEEAVSAGVRRIKAILE